MRVAVILLLCLFLLGPAALAKDDDRAALMALEQEVHAAFAAQDYDTAAEKCREQIALAPSQSNPHYNLACALSRMGKKEKALGSLRKSVELGFHDADHIQSDEDLAALRGEESFAEIVAAARKAAQEAIEKLYEPGEEIEDVATHEGDPEGGLRWRLRIAKDAGPEKRQRLILWMHPSGGSMNRVVEALAPELAARGFALLVPTAKPWMSWSGAEVEKLLGKTLEDVGKIKGLDVSKPLLLGFSAGGQMALSLWSEDPSRFGGLVLDAAYPIDAGAYQRGEIKAIDLPAGEAKKSVPLFVLVGDQDGGHQVWKQVETPWSEAGVPLTVIYVPGGRHEWLLKGEHKTAFLEWLAKLDAQEAEPEESE